MLSGMCFPAPPSVIPNIISAYESEMQINSSLKKKKKINVNSGSGDVHYKNNTNRNYNFTPWNCVYRSWGILLHT